MDRSREMRFSRRMLVAITPVGVGMGLYEAWHLAGGLVFLMAFQILILTGVVVGLVRTVRREAARGERR
jgi:hypothetical protein